MSSGPGSTLPFSFSMAPFPEGFQGDTDEVFQQAYANTKAIVQGNLLTGLNLPPGSTLPTTDQGPVAMGGTWYFFDPTSGQYVPQTVTQKTTKNYIRNSAYLVAQNLFPTVSAGGAPPGTGTPNCDMAQFRVVNGISGVVTPTVSVGPTVPGPDNDLIGSAIKYTVTSSTVATPAAGDLYAHEHLVEGSDIAALQGQPMSLAFSCLATVAGTYSVYLTNKGRGQSFVVNFTITTAQAGQWVRIKISGIPPFTVDPSWSYQEGDTGLYIGVVLAVGTQWQTALLHAWQSGFFAGSSANVNMLGVANNAITLTGFKLEPTTAPTYYQTPSFDAEYESVIRYFFTSFNYGSLSAGVAVIGNCHVAGAGVLSYTFPRRMCKPPTVTPYNQASFAAGSVRNASASSDATVAAFTGVPKGFFVAPAIAGSSKYDVLLYYIRADARLS